MSNRTRLAAAVTILFLVASACGSDSGDDAGSGEATTPLVVETTAPGDDTSANGAVEANGEIVDVVALDNTFRPEAVEIVAGTQIRWENRGRNDHDVIPADETLPWGVAADGFAPGDEYTLLFDTPGEYPYFCSIHGTKDVGMIGTVVVLPAER